MRVAKNDALVCNDNGFNIYSRMKNFLLDVEFDLFIRSEYFH